MFDAVEKVQSTAENADSWNRRTHIVFVCRDSLKIEVLMPYRIVQRVLFYRDIFTLHNTAPTAAALPAVSSFLRLRKATAKAMSTAASPNSPARFQKPGSTKCLATFSMPVNTPVKSPSGLVKPAGLADVGLAAPRPAISGVPNPTMN